MVECIIEIRPHRGGWQAFEAPGVQPYFTGPDAKERALNYAHQRCGFRKGEIRVFDAAGVLEQAMPFDGTGKHR